MTSRFRQLVPEIPKLVTLLLAAWLIFNLTQTIQHIIDDYTQIPFADYWRVPQFWPDYKSFHFANLWVQHNEHRILFPEITYILDMSLAHGHMYLPIALSGLCYAGVWFLLLWAAHSKQLTTALLLSGIVMAWKGCSSAIAMPFLLQITMLQLTAALSLTFLIKTADTGRWKYLAATVAAAATGIYTSGNGMVMWPVLIAAAILLKLSHRQLAALTLAGACFTALFFFHYHPLPSHMPENSTHPIQELEFLCSYMSMPFGSFKSPSFGVTVGAINLLAMGACAAAAWRRRLITSRLGVMVFGLYLFTLLSAMMTTAGRMDPTDPWFVNAKAWRYITMPTVAWALLAFALVWVIGETQFKNWSIAAALLLAAFFGYGFVKARHWIESTRLDAQNGQIAAIMLRNNIFDEEQIKKIFPHTEFVRTNIRTLREDRKSIWADGDDKWLGQDITNSLRIGDPIAGRITRVYPVPGGLQLIGWADTSSLTDDHDVLFVNSNHKIVGFGQRPAAGMPSDITMLDTPNALAFVGYVARATPTETLSVYVGSTHRKYWHLMQGPETISPATP